MAKSWQRASYKLPGITTILLCCIVWLTCATYCQAEYFSSTDNVQMLSDLELDLVKAFRNCLKIQKAELHRYSKFLQQVKLQHQMALEDPEEYVANPLNAFTLIKRLNIDWQYLNDYLRANLTLKELQQDVQQLSEKRPMPDNKELRGAAKGIGRLQHVYLLKVMDLANGLVYNAQTDNKLDWHDCFELGANLFEAKEYEFAAKWLELALNKLSQDLDPKENNYEKAQAESKEPEEFEVKKKFTTDMLEYLVMSYWALQELDKAISYIDALLAIEPDHIFKGLQTYFKSMQSVKLPKNPQYDWLSNYTRLCRGERVPEPVHHKLKCQLTTNGNSAFILAPLRKEQLAFEPEVSLYHGLLNDAQITKILSEGYKRGTERSRVVADLVSDEIQDVRVSQQTWLWYNSTAMKIIDQLASNITGFNLFNAESMQLANYGIGGQYEPHYDFLRENGLWMGDRLATLMFYFSDVEQGGYTVFPVANVFTRPIKGSMVMWHNLHKDLGEDKRTLHAGCPVVTGTKRIGNVWVHSGLQEFVRPCSLKSDSFKSASYE